jgi:hypothetical protein
MLLKMPVEGGRSVYVNVDNLMVVAVKEVSENSIRVVFHFSNEKSFQYTLPMSLSEFEEALSLATSIYDVSKKEFVSAPELQAPLYPPFLPQPETMDFSFLAEEPMTETERLSLKRKKPKKASNPKLCFLQIRKKRLKPNKIFGRKEGGMKSAGVICRD